MQAVMKQANDAEQNALMAYFEKSALLDGAKVLNPEIWMPMDAVGVGVVMVGSTGSRMPVTHSEPDMLPVLLVGAMVVGDGVTTGTVLRPIDWNSVEGDGEWTSVRCALVFSCCLGAFGGVMAADRVVAR